ncbi:MAG: peptide-methionine (S)-S-oxide reductase MsrA [Candidatus Lokiarchaeota archaeon]|nr:peptide-methionine (S)-S-oxide reductase MsrA [Candidatus Lokiarchaeota archaeon]
MKSEKIIFGAGCFWSIEETFRKLKGVINTTVGYSGGTFKNPTYEDVCSDKTGHAEVIQIEYLPLIITLEELLDNFWNLHDPTSLNHQGPDFGKQYRSVIFYHNPKQKEIILNSKNKIEKSGKYKNPIVTEILPINNFYRAEEYHQQYLKKRKTKFIFEF